MQSPITVERGIGRYVTEYAVAVEERHPGAIEGWMLRPEMPVPVHAPLLVRRARFRLQDDPGLDSPDIWHTLSPFESLMASVDTLWPTWARGSRTKLVTTLYDLIPLLYPERYLGDPPTRKAYMRRLQFVERSDRILAISEATADDGIRLLGIPARKFDVVGTGVSEHFVPEPDPAVAFEKARIGLPTLRHGYVMYTGGIDFRKNVDGLLLAFSMLPSELRRKHQLVIVCRVQDSEREHLEQQARALGIADEFLLTGFVSDELLLALYQAAHLFVFPSLYEGFGLPVVEALSCGVPAIVGANSSLTELVTDPRAQFDATVPDAIARALFSALADDAFRESLRRDASATDYSWSVVAERTLEAYASVHAQSRQLSTRSRIALISPMPPAASGVADYSMSLLEHLSELARVEVFTSPDAHRPSLKGVDWYSYNDFDMVERIRGTHDARIFALGNSAHHVEPLRILRAKGGIVMAHDVCYTGLMGALSRDNPDMVDAKSAQLLHDMATGQRPLYHRDHMSIAINAYYTLNGLLCAPVLGNAKQILVHSDVAAMLARANLPAWQRATVSIVPFGHTLRPASPQEQRDVVASFGIIHNIKESDTVCAAFIELAPRHPGVKFALVGEVVDPDLGEELQAMVDRSGLGNRLLLTGRVDDQEYSGWLKRAKLAVQLRAHSNGETSGAVADCLGAEVAVVTSNAGAAASLAGVTQLVEPGISVQDLVKILDDLLSDDEARADLAVRGLEYAKRNSFDVAARAVLARALKA